MSIEIWKLDFLAEVAIGDGWTEDDTDELRVAMTNTIKQRGYLNDLMVGHVQLKLYPDDKNERPAV